MITEKQIMDIEARLKKIKDSVRNSGSPGLGEFQARAKAEPVQTSSPNQPKDVILFNGYDNGFTHPDYAAGLKRLGFELGIVGTGWRLRSALRRAALLAQGITETTDPKMWWDEVYLSPGALQRQGFLFATMKKIEDACDVRFTHFLGDVEDWATKYYQGPYSRQWQSPEALGDAARLDTDKMLALFATLMETAAEFEVGIEHWGQYGLPRRPHASWPAGTVNVVAGMAYMLERHGIKCGNAIYPRLDWDTSVGAAEYAQSTRYDMVVMYPCWQNRPGRPYVEPREYLRVLGVKPHTQCWIWDDWAHHGKNPHTQYEWAMRFRDARQEMRERSASAESARDHGLDWEDEVQKMHERAASAESESVE